MPIASNPDTGEVLFLDPTGKWSPATTAVNPDTKEMVAFDGAGWEPVQKTKGVLNYVDDAVRSIASGITFGWADEFSAKMDETLGRGGNYSDNLAAEQRKDAQIPITIQLPGEIAGAIGTTALVAPLGVIKAIAATTKGLPQWMRFAGLGAAEGAVAGAGNASPDNRLSGAATGAAVGGVIGGVTPSVVNAVTSTARNVAGAFSPKAGAAADIGRAIVRDDTTPEALAKSLLETGAERPGVATLADVGGENVRGLVERVAQTPGAGRTIAKPALTTRQTQQLTRISDDLSVLTGTSKSARQAIDQTIAERSAAAEPLYKAAYDFNARNAPDVVRAWQNVTSSGYGKGIINSADFRKTLQSSYGIKDAADAPLMVQIDTFKKLADDVVGSAKTAGNKNRARVVGEMRDGLLKIIDDANPAYPKARAAFAGPSKYIEAVDEGRTILSSKIDAEEFGAKLAAMNDSEREAARIGAVSAIRARIGNDPATLADLTKYLRSPEMRAKIVAIMPTPEAAKSWNKRLSFEIDSSKLVGQSLGNSATARRLAEMDDAKGIVGDLVVDAMTGGGATSEKFLSKILGTVPRWMRDTIRSRTDKELASILLDPKRAADLPNILKKMKPRASGATSDATKAAVVGAGVNLAE